MSIHIYLQPATITQGPFVNHSGGSRLRFIGSAHSLFRFALFFALAFPVDIGMVVRSHLGLEREFGCRCNFVSMGQQQLMDYGWTHRYVCGYAGII